MVGGALVGDTAETAPTIARGEACGRADQDRERREAERPEQHLRVERQERLDHEGIGRGAPANEPRFEAA